MVHAMVQCDSAKERFKYAVAGALREHRGVALAAEGAARAVVQASARLLADAALTRSWRTVASSIIPTHSTGGE